MASSGLMEHLVEEVLRGSSGFKCAASLQIDFDLLGELIKFNPAMFARLNRALEGDRFNRFVEVSEWVGGQVDGCLGGWLSERVRWWCKRC